MSLFIQKETMHCVLMVCLASGRARFMHLSHLKFIDCLTFINNQQISGFHVDFHLNLKAYLFYHPH